MRKIDIKKKGSVVDILIFMVFAFIIVVFFGLWVYGFNLVTEELTSIKTTTDSINISGVSEDIFGEVNRAQTKGLHVLAWVMIFAMAFSMLMGNFLIKSHPAFLVVYVLVVIVAIIGSVYLSNEYEDMLQEPSYGQTLQEFKGGSYILLNLPMWVTIIGFMGAIFLFIGIMRDREITGGIS